MKQQVEKGSIFQGRWNNMIYKNVRDPMIKQFASNYNDDSMDMSQLAPSPIKRDIIYDGFNIRKQFKFEQYNKLITMKKSGRVHFDPLKLVLGD